MDILCVIYTLTGFVLNSLRSGGVSLHMTGNSVSTMRRHYVILRKIHVATLPSWTHHPRIYNLTKIDLGSSCGESLVQATTRTNVDLSYRGRQKFKYNFLKYMQTGRHCFRLKCVTDGWEMDTKLQWAARSHFWQFSQTMKCRLIKWWHMIDN